MTRPCDVETPDDFRRYYTGSWMALQVEGRTRPICPLQGGEGNTLVHQELFKKDDNFVIGAKAVIGWDDLKNYGVFGCPRVGMVQSMGTVIYGAKVAERNSRRGLSLPKLVFYDFNTWDLRRKYPNLAEPTSGYRYDLIWNYFNPLHYTFTDAMAALEEGKVAGVPLNSNYALYTSNHCGSPLLAYKRWTVGVIEKDSIAVNRRFRDYQEEVYNLCQFPVRLV